jgi:hypothetical protein
MIETFNEVGSTAGVRMQCQMRLDDYSWLVCRLFYDINCEVYSQLDKMKGVFIINMHSRFQTPFYLLKCKYCETC